MQLNGPSSRVASLDLTIYIIIMPLCRRWSINTSKPSNLPEVIWELGAPPRPENGDERYRRCLDHAARPCHSFRSTKRLNSHLWLLLTHPHIAAKDASE